MAKPIGSARNLHCTYCYYLSKAQLPGGPGSGRMSPETLEAFVRQYIEGHDYEEVVFSWQGGEPTLLGLDFFREVARLPKLGEPAARPGHPDSVVTGWSVDPHAYGEFLCRVFDEWYRADLSRVLVNLLETLVTQHLGLGSQLCIFGPFCGKALAVEHDGSVYSCDHYVYPEYRLGNIHQTALAEMAFSPRQESFAYAKRETLPQLCRQCQHLSDCWGECPRHRLLRTPMGDSGLNYLRPGLRTFFNHARPLVARIVAQLRPSRRRDAG